MLSLVDINFDKQLCRYSLTRYISNFLAYHFADIVKDDLEDRSFIIIE